MERLSIDQLEQRLADDECLIARIRARQIHDLAELDRAQVATSDGSRSLSEWLAARIDVSIDTARTLVRTMRRLQDLPRLEESLTKGDVSFDRVEALSRIPGVIGLLGHLDVAGVHAEAAKRVRITSDHETRSASDQYLVMQPSLDRSWWKLWGGLDGHSGSIVDKAMTEAADQLPLLPDGTRGDPAWRKAQALVQICVSDAPPSAQVTVIVDAAHAAPTNGEAGVLLDAGPRVGQHALQAILCDARVEVTARSESGIPMIYGRSQRTAPPALKRALLARAQGICEADGCPSRRRLEVHHIRGWGDYGATDPDNLIVLCWFHHHVVIHQRGHHIYRSPEGRIRFRAPDTPARPPPIRGSSTQLLDSVSY